MPFFTMSPFTSEFLGTAVLVLLGNTLASSVLLSRTRGENAGWLAVSMGWGLALFVAMWVAASSGAHLNPAITLALVASGACDAGRLSSHLPGQFLGAMAGALVASVVFLPHWRQTEDPSRVLGCFCSVPAIRAPISNLLAEAIGMFVLVFGVHAMVAQPWTPPEALAINGDGIFHTALLWRADWWQFAGAVGVLLGVVMLTIGSSMGGAMNPARDISSRLVHAVLPLPGKGTSDWSYAWVPVVGPLIGALAAVFAAKAVGFGI
jgi:glycerol uptake facilitator protein